MFINLSSKYTKVGQKENIKLVSPKKIGVIQIETFFSILVIIIYIYLQLFDE